MPIVDIEVDKLRFNQVTRQLERALGTAWIPAGLLGEAGGFVQGAIAFSITGSLTPPMLTTVERNLLTPTEGMLIYNTTTQKLNIRTAVAWEQVTSV